ncbi:MAG: ABC transporter ATP-binding protein [Thermodesulfobacteriota bacterium]
MIAIKAENLGKKYEIFSKPSQRLAEMIFPRGRKRHRDMWALKDLNFEVTKGTTCGIIGHNGAGKSTLLRLLSRLSQPTTGRVTVNGKVTSVLQLGAGFKVDFTGRANLFMNCSLLGLSKEEAEEKFTEIVDFAELWDFIDMPVKTYSSGMKMRLTFSIMIAMDPEVLLIDEVIAVGDEYFRGKCFNKINELKRSGKTLVLVTHSLYNLRSICDRVLLLERGRLVANGTADEVVDRYLNMVHAQREAKIGALNNRMEEEAGPPRWGDGAIQIEKVRLLDSEGTERYVYRPNENVVIDAAYRVKSTIKKPVFGIGIFRNDGTYISGLNHLWHRDSMEIEELMEGSSGRVTCTVENLPLLKGSYYISYYCYDHSDAAPTPVDHMEKALVFEVMEGNVIEHGLVSIATSWEIKEGTDELDSTAI